PHKIITGERHPPKENPHEHPDQQAIKRLVQLLPHPSVLPVPQPPPGGHARPEAQFPGGRELPRDPGVQHEQDPGQDLPVVQPLPAGVAGAAREDGQQRLDPAPQLVSDDPRRLLALPHRPTHRALPGSWPDFARIADYEPRCQRQPRGWTRSDRPAMAPAVYELLSSRSIAAAKTCVWWSMSASLVAGDINAML